MKTKIETMQNLFLKPRTVRIPVIHGDGSASEIFNRDILHVIPHEPFTPYIECLLVPVRFEERYAHERGEDAKTPERANADDTARKRAEAPTEVDPIPKTTSFCGYTPPDEKTYIRD